MTIVSAYLLGAVLGTVFGALCMLYEQKYGFGLVDLAIVVVVFVIAGVASVVGLQ